MRCRVSATRNKPVELRGVMGDRAILLLGHYGGRGGGRTILLPGHQVVIVHVSVLEPTVRVFVLGTDRNCAR